MTKGAIVYLGLTEHREETCKEVAKTKTEYETMILDYDKVYKKIKTTFKEDMGQDKKRNKKRTSDHIWGPLGIIYFSISYCYIDDFI